MWLPRILAWWLAPRSTGRAGERAAADHLRRAGYRILARNLRLTLGEIDLVAEAPDRRTLVLVEVKARVLTAGAGPETQPELRVNRAKERKLTALAAALLQRRGLEDRPVRLDVIGVDLPAPGRRAVPVIRHHEAAFESHR